MDMLILYGPLGAAAAALLAINACSYWVSRHYHAGIDAEVEEEELVAPYYYDSVDSTTMRFRRRRKKKRTTCGDN